MTTKIIIARTLRALARICVYVLLGLWLQGLVLFAPRVASCQTQTPLIVETYGGDNELYKEYDLDFCSTNEWCQTVNYEGDVYLKDNTFHLFGPYIGTGGVPLSNVPGVVYNDGSVRIENVRKTDSDSLSVAKLPDHVHYRVTLTACCFSGGAHRYIRIHVKGQNTAWIDVDE
jgi:hypothetical protein